MQTVDSNCTLMNNQEPLDLTNSPCSSLICVVLSYFALSEGREGPNWIRSRNNHHALVAEALSRAKISKRFLGIR